MAVSLTTKIGLLDGSLVFVILVGFMDGESAWVTVGRPATLGEGAGVGRREEAPSSEGAAVGANRGCSARVGACENVGSSFDGVLDGFDGVGAEGVGA
jgi:hypothetical protein